MGADASFINSNRVLYHIDGILSKTFIAAFNDISQVFTSIKSGPHIDENMYAQWEIGRADRVGVG
jgi:hypothetical protein